MPPYSLQSTALLILIMLSKVKWALDPIDSEMRGGLPRELGFSLGVLCGR